MNLKPVINTAVLFFLLSPLIAQVDFNLSYYQKLYTCKNRMLYGGGLIFQSPATDLKVLQIGIQPQFGGFVANNFAVYSAK